MGRKRCIKGWNGGVEEGGVGSGIMDTEGDVRVCCEGEQDYKKAYCKCFKIRCRSRLQHCSYCPMYIFTRIKNSS